MRKFAIRILSVLLSLMLFFSVSFADGNTFIRSSAAYIENLSVGETITFGVYPQSKVTDDSTISALDGLEKEWVSYGYYSGTGSWKDGKMTAKDYMKYCDITMGESKYRAVYFTEYRPESTGYSFENDRTQQDDNGYFVNTVYYFKYEPLEWRVLDPEEGYVMCNSVIDSQAYQNFVYLLGSNYFNSKAHTNYASDWVTSTLRAWLNNDFYNLAFTEEEKAQIGVSYLENQSVYSSTFDSAPTYDKIFPLSYWDAINPDYGFSTSNSEYDPARRLMATDYAQCQGCAVNFDEGYEGLTRWWLRSPGDSNFSAGVYSYGYTYFSNYANFIYRGVTPAFKFNPKHSICENHNYESSVITKPTCTTDGVMKYICEGCGHTYTDKIEMLGHSYSENLTQPTCTQQGFTTHTCSRCNDSFTDSFTAAKGHSFGEWEITTEPTMEKAGAETRYCADCDTFETRIIEKLPAISVKTQDSIALNYKSTDNINTLIYNPENVKLNAVYESSDPNIAVVDENGNVTATKRGKGTTTITCTLTDENGNTVKDTCDVKVSLTFGQKLIIYVLFGWLWY